MPYPGVPEEDWPKMERCVEKVMAEGHDKESAIAICYTSIAGEKSMSTKASVDKIPPKQPRHPPPYPPPTRPNAAGMAATGVVLGKKIGTMINNIATAAARASHAEAIKRGDPAAMARAGTMLGSAIGANRSPAVPSVAAARAGAALGAALGGYIAPKILQSARGAGQGAEGAGGTGDAMNKRGKRPPLRGVAELGGKIIKSIAKAIHPEPKESGLMVFKGKDGKYRWITLSSNGFEDRDGEVITTKALQDDVDSKTDPSTFGPLTWWHVDGIEIGDCDYRAVEGRVLIESGTFRNDGVAQAVMRNKEKLGVSIEFMHPETEPDADGVFNHVDIDKRSILPKERASNPFTALAVVEKERTMDEQKRKAFEVLVGDPAIVQAVLSSSQKTEEKAIAAGVRHKQADEEEKPAEEKPVEQETPADEKPDEEKQDEEAPVEDVTGDDVKIGDLTVQEFVEVVAQVVTAVGEEKVTEQAKEVSALKEAQDKLTAAEKRAQDAEAELAKTKKELEDIQSDLPKALRKGAFVASTDPATVIKETPTGPHENPSAQSWVDPFVNALGAQNQTPAPLNVQPRE